MGLDDLDDKYQKTLSHMAHCIGEVDFINATDLKNYKLKIINIIIFVFFNIISVPPVLRWISGNEFLKNSEDNMFSYIYLLICLILQLHSLFVKKK